MAGFVHHLVYCMRMKAPFSLTGNLGGTIQCSFDYLEEQ